MQTAYIYDAVRTPRGLGKEKGSLKNVKPVHLLKPLYHAIVKRNQLDKELLDSVILGCNTMIKGQGANIAKISALYAGLAYRTTGVTLSSFCTSGLDAFNTAAMRIMVGTEQLNLAGGVESMSRIPILADEGAWFADQRVAAKTKFIHMGVAADLVATLAGLNREELDAYAVRSHQRAATATKEGRFAKSLVAVTDKEGTTLLDQDEIIRPNISNEKMAQLPAIFTTETAAYFDAVALQTYPQLTAVEHLHNIGTAPALADAASLLLLGNEETGKQLNLRPRARLVSFASHSVEPVLMLTAPAQASRKALKQAGLKVADIDLFEMNESFAAPVLHYQRELEIEDDKLNVNGGAIAMGHPLGATGCDCGILLGTLLNELERQNKRYGLCTICAGAGLATATIIERV